MIIIRTAKNKTQTTGDDSVIICADDKHMILNHVKCLPEKYEVVERL